jgi:hypothetical protein
VKQVFDDVTSGLEPASGSCEHARLKQESAVLAETFWSRNEAGGYDPEPEGPICLSRIVSEETVDFVCVECGERVAP